MPANEFQFHPSDEDNSDEDVLSFDHADLTGVPLPPNPFPVNQATYNHLGFNVSLHHPPLIIQPPHNPPYENYHFQPPVPPPNPPPAPPTPPADPGSHATLSQVSSQGSGTTGKWIMSLNNLLDNDDDISMEHAANTHSGPGLGKGPMNDDMTGSNFSISPVNSGSPCSLLPPVPKPHEAGTSNWCAGALSEGHSASHSFSDSSDWNDNFNRRSLRNEGIHIGKRKALPSDSPLSVEKRLKCDLNDDNLKTISFNKLKRKLGEGFMEAFYGNSVTENGSMGCHISPDSDSSKKKWLIIDCECLSSTKRTKLSPGPVLVVQVPVDPVQDGSCSESKEKKESLNSSEEDTSAAGHDDLSSDSASTSEGEVASLKGPPNSP